MSQLAVNIAAADLRLSDYHVKRPNEASAPVPGFSSGLATPTTRRMVSGGHRVVGWGE